MCVLHGRWLPEPPELWRAIIAVAVVRLIMLKVGLTGSIATGKSHVASILRELGCEVFDADQISREVVEPDRPAFREILAEFGPGVLTSTGCLDREKLGAIVFHDPHKRARLNQIVHPRIMDEINLLLSEAEEMNPNGIVVIDAALIIEAGVEHVFDYLIVSYCDLEEQLKRLRRRDGLSREEALARVGSQLSSLEKRKRADFEVDTSGTFDRTRKQVKRIYSQICARSAGLSKP